MAIEIKEDNQEILLNDNEIIKNLVEANKMISIEKVMSKEWTKLESDLKSHLQSLHEILKELENKFNNKNASELTQIWELHIHHKENVHRIFVEMQHFGEVIFVNNKLKTWNDLFINIHKYERNILHIAETYALKLEVMESLRPEEIDDLTESIIKHIPWGYSEEEAKQYEREYLQAYNQLKEEQSKKKNLWDKVINILAGGIQETPAHRVQMRRWMDGNE